MQAQTNEHGPSAPELQLDWPSSSSDSDDTDDDSGIEVVSVKYQQQSAQKVSWCLLQGELCRDQSALRVSWCELQSEKCVQNGKIFLRFVKETRLGVSPVGIRNALL
jgi:hypothetical protein